MFTPQSLVYRLIVHIKQHRKPGSAKSTSVLMKTMDKQLLGPKESRDDLKADLQKALDSNVVLSELLRQQHSEEDIRNCFASLIAAIDAPEVEEPEEIENIPEDETHED